MKRILATAGIAGLAFFGVAAPANAGSEDKISICHATGSESNPCPGGAKSKDDWKHDDRKDRDWKHDDRKDGGWKDHDWKDGGWKDHDWKDHEKPPVEKPPVEQPPVEQPPVVVPPVVVPPVVVPPVVAPPVVTPPVVTPVVVPPVVAPPAVTRPVAVAVPAGAAAAPVVNRGFNAQTAAGTQTDSGVPAWFGGLAALLGATGLVALRHRGRLQDFPK